MTFSHLPAPSGVFERPSKVIVVLGMHRSGTSAVAGSLHRLGVDFGPRLMPPTSANERGYYEHIDVVNLHDRLLLALNSSWDETAPLPEGWEISDSRAAIYREEMLALLRRDFDGKTLWGLKDPRLCRLLPWWETLWPELNATPLFLIVLREPEEIAASLVRREGFSEEKAYLLWLQHLIEAERQTRGQRRVFIDFEDFLSRPAGVLRVANEALGGVWQSEVARLEVVQSDFLDQSLRHRPSNKWNETSLSPLIERTRAALRQGLSNSLQLQTMQKELDQVREGLPEALRHYESMIQLRVTDLAQQLAATKKQAQWYEAEWRKAARRLSKAEARKAQVKGTSENAPRPIFSYDNNTSFMRKHFVSKTIKRLFVGFAKRFFR